MPNDQWMRATETAKHINVREQTLAKWRMLNEGPPYAKVGRAIRYSRARVDEWLESQTVETAK